MAKQHKDGESAPAVQTNDFRKIANLLALVVTQDKKQADAILTLGAAGFSASEIAALLRTTTNTVSVRLSQAKAKRKAKRGAKKHGKD